MAQQKRKHPDLIWNILTTMIVLATLVIGSILITIFLNPHSMLNPFPPMELPVVVQVPEKTATVELQSDLPTELPSPTENPTIVPSPTATTQVIMQEATPLPEVTLAAPTETPFVGYLPFALQNEPNAINSTLFKPDQGCNWLGVAGQVFDLQGRPVKGIRVLLQGKLAGKEVDYLSLTLESSPYGPSGYEIQLADQPIASWGSMFIQLLDQAGIPISNKVYFDTYDDCEKNLILINFKQVR